MSKFAIPDSDSEDELPPGWEERSTVEGEVFYANHFNKSTQWTHPRTGKRKRLSGSLPFGWERQISDDGKVIYIDHINGRTTFSDPRLAFATEKSKTFVRQRFDASTPAEAVLHGKDLSGSVVVITGANSGIGFEMARVIVRHGGKVVLGCRTLEKAETARKNLGRHGMERGFPFEVDLKSLKSVHKFAETIIKQFDKIDVLVLNAAVFGIPFKTTENGCEEMFQVNYLSQVYLTLLLRDHLSKVRVPRVIFMTSESHRFATLSLETVSMASFFPTASNFMSIANYNNTKLLSLMFALEISQRWFKHGIRAYPVHPGNLVSTNFYRNWWVYRVISAMVRPFAKSVHQAASSPIFAAFAPEMENAGGTYVNNCFPCQPSDLALNPEMREKCWQLTKEILAKKLEESGLPVKVL